jgi:hypothetical protein
MQISINSYDSARHEFIEKISKFNGVTTIYECGSVSAPGLSDLDFLIVIDELIWTPHQTNEYYKVVGSFSNNLKKLIGEGNILVVPNILQKKIKIIDNFNLKALYSLNDCKCKNFDTNEYQISRVMDWLPERISKICHIYNFYKEIYKSDILHVHGIIKSLNVTLKTIKNIIDEISIHEKINQQIEKTEKIRNEWFFLKNNQKEQKILSLLESSIRIGKICLIEFERYINKKLVLKYEGILSSEKRFHLFDLDNTIKIINGRSLIRIPTTYFIHYFIQGSFKCKVSKRIMENLMISDLDKEKILIDLDYLNIQKKRIEFIDINLNFLMRNNFKNGLLKYGMLLK